MKHKIHRLWIVALAAAGLALLAGISIAGMAVTPWTATETPGTLIDQGKTTTSGGQTQFRGVTRQYIRQASDPRVSGGTLNVVANLNLDQNGTGPIWGSFHWEVGKGAWDGIFHGYFNMATGLGEYQSVGHGSGDFRGLELRERVVYMAQGVGYATGKIIETNGN